MSSIITRRSFLKNLGMTTAALALMKLSAGEIFAKNSAKYWLHGFEDNLYGEESLLRKSLNLAVNRLQEERIWQEIYKHSSYYNHSDSVMERSKLADTEKNRWELLWYQLYWLAQPNSPDDVTPAFPNIHIYGDYEEPDEDGVGWVGRAQLDLVTIEKCDDGVCQTGEFKVKVNRYYSSQPEYQDPEDWGGTIVHEMLHNLGHRHEKGYDIKYQINVADDVIEANGEDYTRSNLLKKGKFKKLPRCSQQHSEKENKNSKLSVPKDTKIYKRA